MLQKLCAYNSWANSLLLEALSLHQGEVPDSCLTLLSHIANAQSIWLDRINGTVPKVTVWQLHDLDTSRVMLQESAAGLTKIVQNNVTPDRTIKYSTFIGEPFETSVSDILLHVFNHSTYHRAQIAKEMKIHGIKPINTDYIQFVR